MKFTIYGEKGRPKLFLLPGLGVSTEIYLPLIERLKDHFYIIAAGVSIIAVAFILVKKAVLKK